jgi:amidophosphoribosyltransferase
MLRDVAPGEAVLIDTAGQFPQPAVRRAHVRAPCIFEFVYLARPDSLIDGISVYEARVKMGEHLAEKIRHTMPHLDIDVGDPDSRFQPPVGDGAGHR